MFERFDEGARRVVVLAQEQARSLDHGYIGTEHLLLGVLALDGPVADVLGRHGVSLDAVTGQVEAIIGTVPGPRVGHIPFTPRAKEVLELSLREAMRLDHWAIGPAHVVLGLLREGQGVAYQALVLLGADAGRLRSELEAAAGDVAAIVRPPSEASMSLGDAQAVLAALRDAFGDDVRLGSLRRRPSGEVLAIVQRSPSPRPDVVELVLRDDRWVVHDRP